jgi:hypothetical protein
VYIYGEEEGCFKRDSFIIRKMMALNLWIIETKYQPPVLNIPEEQNLLHCSGSLKSNKYMISLKNK